MTDTIIELITQQIEAIVIKAVDSAIEKNIKSFLKKEDEVLDITSAASLIKKSQKTIYRLVAERNIPFAKQGRRLIFFKSELIDWLKEHHVKSIGRLQASAESTFLAIKKRGP